MNTHPVEKDPTDLAESIVAIMVAAGHPDPRGWLAGVHPEGRVTESVKPALDLQRFHINRAWRQILGSLTLEQQNETRQERMALLDSVCQPHDYLVFFRDLIIPCALKFNLPKQK